MLTIIAATTESVSLCARKKLTAFGSPTVAKFFNLYLKERVGVGLVAPENTASRTGGGVIVADFLLDENEHLSSRQAQRGFHGFIYSIESCNSAISHRIHA